MEFVARVAVQITEAFSSAATVSEAPARGREELRTPPNRADRRGEFGWRLRRPTRPIRPSSSALLLREGGALCPPAMSSVDDVTDVTAVTAGPQIGA